MKKMKSSKKNYNIALPKIKIVMMIQRNKIMILSIYKINKITNPNKILKISFVISFSEKIDNLGLVLSK